MSVGEAARTLGLSEATVYPRVWDGSLPIVRLSEQDAIRFPRTALEVPAGVPCTVPTAVEAPGARRDSGMSADCTGSMKRPTMR